MRVAVHSTAPDVSETIMQEVKPRNELSHRLMEPQGLTSVFFCARPTSCCRTCPMVKTARTTSTRLPIANRRNCSMITGESQPNRPHLGHHVVRRHLQPARGHRTDHLPAVHQAPRRTPDAQGEQGRPARQADEEPHLSQGKDAEGTALRRSPLVALQAPRRREMFTVAASTSSRSCARWAATTPPTRTT